MTKYRLVDEDALSRILESLRELIGNSPELNFPSPGGKPPEEPPKEKINLEHSRGRRGPSLADVIFDRVTLTKFTPRQAYEIINPFVQFRGDRYLDSIRIAMKKDKRFGRNNEGLYFKIHQG